MLRSALRLSFVAALLVVTGSAAGSCKDPGTDTDTRPPSEGTPSPGAGAVGGAEHGDPRTVPGKGDQGGVPGSAGGSNITHDGGAGDGGAAATPTAPAAPNDAGAAPVEPRR